MKGQHGGPGRGQGRKPGSRLHLAERIELAIECARRWEAMQDRDAKDRQDTLDDTAKGRKLKALRERFVHRDAGLRRQPSRGRLRGDEPPKTLEGMRLPAKDNDEFYKAKEKISKEIHKIGRIYTTRKRPKGHRTTVIAEVANWWNKKFPWKRVTARYVKTCHDEYRKFLRDKVESNEKKEHDAILEWQNLTSPEKS